MKYSFSFYYSAKINRSFSILTLDLIDSLDLPYRGLDSRLDPRLDPRFPCFLYILYPVYYFCCFLSFLVLVDYSREPVGLVGNLLA